MLLKDDALSGQSVCVGRRLARVIVAPEVIGTRGVYHTDDYIGARCGTAQFIHPLTATGEWCRAEGGTLPTANVEHPHDYSHDEAEERDSSQKPV